jgi:hypothetical protein
VPIGTVQSGVEDLPDSHFDVTLECAGVPQALHGLLLATRRAGVLVQVGNLPDETRPVNLARRWIGMTPARPFLWPSECCPTSRWQTRFTLELAVRAKSTADAHGPQVHLEDLRSVAERLCLHMPLSVPVATTRAAGRSALWMLRSGVPRERRSSEVGVEGSGSRV